MNVAGFVTRHMAKCRWRLYFIWTPISTGWQVAGRLMLMCRSNILVWGLILAYVIVFPFSYVVFKYLLISTVQLHCSSVCYKLCFAGEPRSVRELCISVTFPCFVHSHFDIKFLFWNVMVYKQFYLQNNILYKHFHFLLLLQNSM